jgi:hypothetical protein
MSCNSGISVGDNGELQRVGAGHAAASLENGSAGRARCLADGSAADWRPTSTTVFNCMLAEEDAAEEEAEGVESETERSMILVPPVDALRPLALFLPYMLVNGLTDATWLVLVNGLADATWLVIDPGEVLSKSSAMVTGGVPDSISCEKTLSLAWNDACAQRRPLIADCSPATSLASPSTAVRSASASSLADAAASGSLSPFAASSGLRPSL